MKMCSGENLFSCPTQKISSKVVSVRKLWLYFCYLIAYVH